VLAVSAGIITVEACGYAGYQAYKRYKKDSDSDDESEDEKGSLADLSQNDTSTEHGEE
jgi:hypothetical protein